MKADSTPCTDSLRTMDRMTKEQRSKCMASIHSKDTKPEMAVRKFLFSKGYRYRLNSPRLPGKPDIVLRKYGTVIFVNGCFWHGHEGCRHYVMPKSNAEFWQSKIDRNRKRDRKNIKLLSEMGWHSIVVWECQLRPAVRERTLLSIDILLNHIYLENRKPEHKPYRLPEEDSGMAAEP